jgi:hypothetical protein
MAPEAVASSHTLIDAIIAICGFGGVSGVTIVAFAKLKTQVGMLDAQNQKDHKEIKAELRQINGAGRKATDAITAIETRCEERHG